MRSIVVRRIIAVFAIALVPLFVGGCSTPTVYGSPTMGQPRLERYEVFRVPDLVQVHLRFNRLAHDLEVVVFDQDKRLLNRLGVYQPDELEPFYVVDIPAGILPKDDETVTLEIRATSRISGNVSTSEVVLGRP